MIDSILDQLKEEHERVVYNAYADGRKEVIDSELKEALKKTDELKEKYNKLKRLLLLTDDSVSHFECGSKIQLAQWNEFIKCFPEEG